MSSLRPSKTKRSGAAGRISLRLYVAGRLPGSLEAEARLRALCAEHGANQPTIEIVDMLQEPERALHDGIVVTPTLLRLSPEPALRILGALSDLERVRSALGFGAPTKTQS